MQWNESDSALNIRIRDAPIICR